MRVHIPSSHITPKAVALSRRQLLATAAAGVLGTHTAHAQGVMEPTAFKHATTHNNFLEFGLDKQDPSKHAQSLKTRPWTVTVDGLVHRPHTLDVETLLRTMALEDRVYRFRCVEAWAMVIPWMGIPLAALLARAQPLSSARHVAFQTLMDPQQMPGQRGTFLPWPYTEGLRLDEAQHPLTLMALGMYGRMLPAQSGAPIRLVVPWKYGFKSVKSVVRITLLAEPPVTTWNQQAPTEYGYHANVNPLVPHPRWSQAWERMLGTNTRQRTQLFNGYGPEVAHLYSGMNLRTSF